MITNMDHLVIAAADLDQGISYIKKHLGVDIPFGGVHEQMGTHNHLMKIGDHEFLEVIAVNPRGKNPERPRWFGFDDPYIRRQINRKPLFLTWVINTDHIHECIDRSEISFGRPELISRGNLNWYFALPSDGRLIAGGILPYVIQWQTTHHPAKDMFDGGCRLKKLSIFHPNPSWLSRVLAALKSESLVEINPLPAGNTPYLEAVFDTPIGEKKLVSLSG